ncbi:MAG: type 1 glutamine amidotransferase [Calditrichaeota bacterium]|nr:MAG: type 1 glutamine amidotransferase [Calditrichota bacterium]MBL1204645.1 type 1 glutamine amidotransferase [Calditrichota bacterium]NOG44473.1 type 1 glutamine amidotransferase [Calditrichota bacterium]
MKKNKSDLKILLLQIRHDERVKIEEHNSFAEYSTLHKNQIDILNVFDRPDFKITEVEGYDALFVGGASSANVLKPDENPFLEKCRELLRHCLKNGIPVFASCFGFQLAVQALGGEIIHKEKDFEMGCLLISLSEAAQNDPLLFDTPNNFLAITVHQQLALKEPDGCELLGYTENCSHIFRVKGKPFWAFQFHPEVDKKTMVDRLTIYKKKYTDDDTHLDEILSSAQETPESNILVQKFVERVLLLK